MKERNRLKAKLAKVVEWEGVNVDSATNADLNTTAQSETIQVIEKFPPGSFQRLFWEQQVDAASCNITHGMRWHPG